MEDIEDVINRAKQSFKDIGEKIFNRQIRRMWEVYKNWQDGITPTKNALFVFTELKEELITAKSLEPELSALVNTSLSQIEEITKKISKFEEENKKTAGRLYIKEPMPEWRRKLINAGYISEPDGIRIVNNLPDTATEYVKITKLKITTKFILENFKKPDGKNYTEKTANNARDIANK